MTNLNNLQNISSLNLNTTILTNGNIVDDATAIFITEVPYWLFPVTFIMFFAMLYFIYQRLEWGLDIVQSALIASFFQIIISYAIIKIGWSVSIVPLTMWGIIWLLLLISMYYIKKTR